jgi:Fe-S-cluster containining protein
MPIFYACDRCTACCRWPGEVRLRNGEISRMAAHLGANEFDFIQQYTRLTDDRRGLALMDKPNGHCIFLEGIECLVQPVKPRQCREFPNLWNFPGFEEVCRALPRDVNDDDYARLVREVTS